MNQVLAVPESHRARRPRAGFLPAAGLVVLAMVPAAAAALPACNQSVGDSRYLLHLDGMLARAYLRQADDALLTRRLSDQVTAALEFIAQVDPGPPGDRATRARPLACTSRDPRVEGDFDSGEIGRLDEDHVLVESWVLISEDEDDEGNPLSVVRFSQLLVPVAASDEGVTGAPEALFTFERRIPGTAVSSEIRKDLVMDREIAAATFACGGLKRMRAKKYDDAYAYLLGALAAVREITDEDRRQPMAEIETFVVNVAWENWKRARADNANPSDVRSLAEDDLKAVFGGTP